jgi:uncharacterized membrane protein
MAGVSTAMPRRSSQRPYVLRLIRARPRLFLSSAVGLLLALGLPAEWRLETRLLLAWDIAVALYLVLVYHLMAGSSDIERIRKRAALEDEGRIGILVLTVAAALASLAAILVELAASSHGGSGTLATLTILLSWGLTHTIFALHYAHEFYRDEDDGCGAGGLTFPGGEDPDYWDFVYFSFVIGMTSQVSDVAVASKMIRRTVTAHGVVSFIFNAALLALTVNIASNFLLNAP